MKTIDAYRSLRHHLLRRSGRSYGSLLLSNSPVIAELMGGMGYGHLIVDHEHSMTDISSGTALLQAIRSSALFPTTSNNNDASNMGDDTAWNLNRITEPIVRVPSSDPVYMKKVLDTLRLPGGILVPMVETATEARDIVRSVRYPDGKDGGARGFAAPLVRASQWGTMKGGTDAYLQQCKEDLLVAVQVETVNAVGHISEIGKVDGIDMIFLGPYDLSASVGKPGQFDDPEVKDLIQTAEQMVLECGCLLGGFRSPGRDLNDMLSVGYSLVTGGSDMGMLREASKKDVMGAWDLRSQ